MWVSEQRTECKQCDGLVVKPKRAFCSDKCRELWHGRSERYKKYQRARYHQLLAQQRERGARRQIRLKREMIAAYSTSGSCECCGETGLAFLTLDHIKRDGTADRLAFGGSHRLWSSLKKRGWPDLGYRILCMNCNFATRYGRPCPHTVEVLELIKCG
jgi:hypothetical protein